MPKVQSDDDPIAFQMVLSSQKAMKVILLHRRSLLRNRPDIPLVLLASRMRLWLEKNNIVVVVAPTSFALCLSPW